MQKYKKVIWVLIIIIVALVVILIVGARGTEDASLEPEGTANENTTEAINDDTTTRKPQATQPKVPSAPARTKAIKLLPKEGPKTAQMGSATLTEMPDGRTKVIVGISSPIAGVFQPAQIHEDNCDLLGGVEYGLNNLNNGYSETIIPASFDTLTSGKKAFAIAVYKSIRENLAVTSCGNIASY